MKALSLFSGIGGIDLACDWAGIETVAFCEREPFCQTIIRKHWPGVPIYDDVRTLTKERLEADGIDTRTIGLISAGYPCQPFSVAGKREGEEDDRHLWPEVFRLVKEIGPDWLIGENVAGHVTLGLDNVLSDLGDIRYTFQPFVIPACAVNAPHRRDRVFIVAHAPINGRDTRRAESEGQQGELWVVGGGSQTSFVSDTAGERRGEEREFQHKRKKERTAGCCETVPDSNGPESPESWNPRERGAEFGDGGVSERHRHSPDHWSTEPDVGRVANGIPNRVDRLKALGNAVVPQQIYPILAAIKKIDDTMRTG